MIQSEFQLLKSQYCLGAGAIYRGHDAAQFYSCQYHAAKRRGQDQPNLAYPPEVLLHG